MLQFSIKGLSKRFRNKFGENEAYANINIEISAGEFICIVGPSGCGKTTLLRTIAGLEKPTTGELVFNRDVTLDPPLSIGMVFQEQALFPWMTVSANIKFFLENNPNIASHQRNEIAQSYLSKVGLSDFAQSYPYQLSGGMKQRVSLARSFANEPDILLMDEPFVYLDYQTRQSLHRLLISIWEDMHRTVIFVSHDIEEALVLADRIIVMSANPGQIKAEIAVDFPRPRELHILKLSKNFVEKFTTINQYLTS